MKSNLPVSVIKYLRNLTEKDLLTFIVKYMNYSTQGTKIYISLYNDLKDNLLGMLGQ